MSDTVRRPHRGEDPVPDTIGSQATMSLVSIVSLGLLSFVGVWLVWEYGLWVANWFLSHIFSDMYRAMDDFFRV